MQISFFSSVECHSNFETVRTSFFRSLMMNTIRRSSGHFLTFFFRLQLLLHTCLNIFTNIFKQGVGVTSTKHGQGTGLCLFSCPYSVICPSYVLPLSLLCPSFVPSFPSFDSPLTVHCPTSVPSLSHFIPPLSPFVPLLSLLCPSLEPPSSQLCPSFDPSLSIHVCWLSAFVFLVSGWLKK